MSKPSSPLTVNFIGSGVLGLTCALKLAKQPGLPYLMNVVTAKNELAGWIEDPSKKPLAAFWHPFIPHPETELQKRVAQWETTSFKHLWEIAEDDPSVFMVSG
ncbi:hypothetical protein PGTUg99_034565 [Puccinia graminis f. sp. tritici]|uniref:FAD dependent oxidoreductase domain-containing protein n=1 Tax=Puccinia graminis f. sp. tritici TaxID=56615 RepID=A0A5B0SM73_PUCGR|nr:hypothetical protein PGTUg99_034565 [Puccinia graminis f. sp. tritici]